MAEQIAYGDLRVRLRVAQLEVRQKFFGRVVEREFTVVCAHDCGHGREGFRRRTDGEERVGRDGQIVFDVPETKPLEVDHAVVFDDAEGNTGNTQCFAS